MWGGVGVAAQCALNTTLAVDIPLKGLPRVPQTRPSAVPGAPLPSPLTGSPPRCCPAPAPCPSLTSWTWAVCGAHKPIRVQCGGGQGGTASGCKCGEPLALRGPTSAHRWIINASMEVMLFITVDLLGMLCDPKVSKWLVHVGKYSYSVFCRSELTGAYGPQSGLRVTHCLGWFIGFLLWELGRMWLK